LAIVFYHPIIENNLRIPIIVNNIQHGTKRILILVLKKKVKTIFQTPAKRAVTRSTTSISTMSNIPFMINKIGTGTTDTSRIINAPIIGGL
tara:strand:+ start:1261 stop:1533 length:273 start_codon:yes stop_codon:yes gene_type:complete